MNPVKSNKLVTEIPIAQWVRFFNHELRDSTLTKKVVPTALWSRLLL